MPLSPDEPMESLVSRLETATYALTLLVGIAGLSFLFFNRRLQRILKAENQEIQRVSDEKIAAAQATAENARAEQEKLKEHNLQLAQQYEQEKIARLKLEKEFSPRRLSEEQVRTLARLLHTSPPRDLELFAVLDGESKPYAEQILSAVESSKGWNLRTISAAIAVPPIYGVVLTIPGSAVGAQSAEILIKAFKAANVEYTVTRGENLKLSIGTHPIPLLHK